MRLHLSAEVATVPVKAGGSSNTAPVCQGGEVQRTTSDGKVNNEIRCDAVRGAVAAGARVRSVRVFEIQGF